MTGRVGHGTGRFLETTTCTRLTPRTHEHRVRPLPDGTMTGGNQPTYIRGIDRRMKVPSARHLQAPANQNSRDG
jgi:hypothetical protein